MLAELRTYAATLGITGDEFDAMVDGAAAACASADPATPPPWTDEDIERLVELESLAVQP